MSTITETPLHSELHQDMLCPISGQVEPMKLQLYSVEKKHLLFHKIYKRPSAKFIQVQTGQEIAEEHWTTQMRTAYKSAIKAGSPVAGRGCTLTLLGKIALGLLTTLFLFLAFVIAKHYWIDVPRAEALRSEVKRIPDKGDLYFVYIEDLQYEPGKALKAKAWAKVTDVYRADSTIHLQLSTDLIRSGQSKSASQAERKAFAGYVYTTKFVPNEEGNQIAFEVIGRNALIRVDSITELSSAKIPIKSN